MLDCGEVMVVEGRGLGHHDYLRQYETDRQRHNRTTIGGVDCLQKLYCTNNIPMVLARSLGVMATNAAQPVKKLIMQLKELLENVPVMNETKSDEVQNNDPLEAPGGLEGLRSILKTSSACEVSLDDQSWSHLPLLYNVSGLPILPLASSNNLVVRVVVGETITLSFSGSKGDQN